jgi:uncharacterized protein (DUF4415 family)
VNAATPGQDSCGCPETDGKIYHQRGTCTDPVAARLDWYADGPAPAAAATPGQADETPPSLHAQATQVARELRREADGIEADPYLNKFAREADAGARRTAAARVEMAVAEDRSKPVPTVRSGIEQALQTLRRMGDACAPSRAARVRAALAESERLIREAYDGTGDLDAQEPHAAPELQTGPCPFQGHHGEHLRLNTHDHWLCAITLTDMLVAADVIADPAPELAAAMRESRLRAEVITEVLADVLGWFHNGGDGYRARVSGVRLVREYKRATLPVPDRLRHLEGQ